MRIEKGPPGVELDSQRNEGREGQESNAKEGPKEQIHRPFHDLRAGKQQIPTNVKRQHLTVFSGFDKQTREPWNVRDDGNEGKRACLGLDGLRQGGIRKTASRDDCVIDAK